MHMDSPCCALFAWFTTLGTPASLRRTQALMREQVRNMDRALSNIESMPGGFNALAQFHSSMQVGLGHMCLRSQLGVAAVPCGRIPALCFVLPCRAKVVTMPCFPLSDCSLWTRRPASRQTLVQQAATTLLPPSSSLRPSRQRAVRSSLRQVPPTRRRCPTPGRPEAAAAWRPAAARQGSVA